MKTDRSIPKPLAAAAIVLAALLVLPGPPVRGQFVIKVNHRTSVLAASLAREVKLVQKKFGRSRRELTVVRSSGGGRAYPRQEVAGLIALAETDLDQAIERVGEPGLAALRAWSAEEFQRIQGELAATADHTTASSHGLPTPRAVAVVASLGGLPLPVVASAASPQQETITAETSNRFLDQAGEVIGRIFTLAKKNNLVVKVWIGSTPKPSATFSFWPQGKIKGSTPAHMIVRTNAKRDRVLRGLYYYRASLGQGLVSEVVEYPPNPTAPAAQLPSERLDLVNGSSFFCCRFNEQYCLHVDNEKECRP